MAASAVVVWKTSAAARPQQAGRFWHPAVRVAPQARAALRDGQVKAPAGKRGIRRVGLYQRESDPEPVLAPARGVELGRSQVDPGRPSTAPGQPGRQVRGPATEFHHIQPGHVTQDAELGLWHVEDAPGDLVGGPGPEGMLIGILGIRPGPEFPVGSGVISGRSRVIGHAGLTASQPSPPPVPASSNPPRSAARGIVRLADYRATMWSQDQLRVRGRSVGVEPNAPGVRPPGGLCSR